MSSKMSVFSKNKVNLLANKEEQFFEWPPVSIIITCHNQGFQLQENLPQLLKQDYPDFQVIVVNDCSSDHSEDVLKELSITYKNLYHTFTPSSARYVSRKKLAITLGVKAAKHEWLLFTEADCKPSGINWLKSMAKHFSNTNNIVIGYANYEPGNGLFQSLIAYDRFIENVYTFRAVINRNIAYRGDFCNMAIRKSLFLQNRGFEKNLFLKRGEDTLLINEIATKNTSKAELSSESLIIQEKPFRKKFWLNDKIYDVETRMHIKNKDRLRDWQRGFSSLISFIFYGLSFAQIILAFALKEWILLGLNILLIALVYGFQVYFIAKSTKAIHERNFGWGLFILEPLRIMFSCYFWLRWFIRSRYKATVNKTVIQNE